MEHNNIIPLKTQPGFNPKFAIQPGPGDIEKYQLNTTPGKLISNQ